jgi:hypothetical protein
MSPFVRNLFASRPSAAAWGFLAAIICQSLRPEPRASGIALTRRAQVAAITVKTKIYDEEDSR